MKITNVGYGCALLMGGISERESLRLLDCAWDQGIRHYDVARSYGYGQSEQVVGKFLRRHRDEATIATKVGLVPPAASAKLNWARAFARSVSQVVPGLKPLFRRRAAAMVARAPLSPDLIRRSFTTSLMQLDTECVDLLLLHECEAEELRDGAVREVLEEFVAAGTVKGFGIGADIDRTKKILAEGKFRPPVVQCENNPAVQATLHLRLDNVSLLLTHGAIGKIFGRVRAQFASQPTLLRSWSNALQIDVASTERLAALFLAWARRHNPSGSILFSTRNEQHLTATARALFDPPHFEAAQFNLLEDLVHALSAR
jgi:D-threo-aldose 1-dehydrogenase